MIPKSTNSCICYSSLSRLGSGGWQFTIYPEFCSQGQFFRIFWVVAARFFFIYPGFYSRRQFSGFFWAVVARFFSICPEFYSRCQFSGFLWAVMSGFSPYTQNYVLYGRFSRIYWHKNCAMALKCHRAAILFTYIFHI